ncbi:MAG: Gfo/Idh/MocA family oxidoreductase [Trueperaceae bacterium]
MNRPPRIGIIGVGGIAGLHREGYLAAGADVVALADVHAPTLAARAGAWGVTRTYPDYHDMLATEDLDAVSICAPTAVHHPATLAAAAAGVHVLCEKPIALDLEQADDMIATCRRAGVVLMVNHQLRSHAAGDLARRMLAAGDLGTLTHVRLRQAHDWAGAREVKPSFATRVLAGGGTLLDNGCHLMDLARYLGGDVAEVFARVAHRKFDVEVEDTGHVSLAFESGAIGTVEVAWTATGWEEGWWLYGSEGTFEYTNRTGVPVVRHAHRTSPGTTWGDTDVSEHRFAGASAHARHVLAFLAAVRGEREVACTGEDGREAVRLVLASYASAESGRPVSARQDFDPL